MSNKSISVYAEALKRQREVESQRSPTQSGSRIGKSQRPNRSIGSQSNEEVRRANLDTPGKSHKRLSSSGVPAANRKVQPNESLQASKHASMHAYMHSVLDEKATYTFAFRYPPDLLERLEDTLHVVKKQYRIKLTKNVVAVTGLAFILWDFETNGKASIVHRLILKRSQ